MIHTSENVIHVEVLSVLKQYYLYSGDRQISTYFTPKQQIILKPASFLEDDIYSF